jgi:twitching motility protein PilT
VEPFGGRQGTVRYRLCPAPVQNERINGAQDGKAESQDDSRRLARPLTSGAQDVDSLLISDSVYVTPSYPSPAFGAPAFPVDHDSPQGFGIPGISGLNERPSNIPAFVGQLARSAPGAFLGEDRLRFYAEHVVRFTSEQRQAVITYLEKFIRQMNELGASDLDMGGPAAAGRVWYRVDGDKRPHEELGSSLDEISVMLLTLAGELQHKELFEENSIDFSYQLPTDDGERRRYRATMYFDFGHLGLCMRAINETAFPMKSLGFHPLIERGMMFSQVRDGLTLVTGVTGSGKSTTLDSIVDANNEDFDGHIVIIAKPIEYMHTSKRCIIRHREVGQDVPTFKDGIIQALRQDPDIIMVGEMRDPETIASAMEASDTGHKVFSTLHTSSAVESLDRIIAEFPPTEQGRIRSRLADTLRCVISQKLAPKVGGGRVLVKEVLWLTSSVRSAIKNDNLNEIYQMIWEGGKLGMITLEQDLARLLRERKITPETAMNYANNKRRLQQLLQ